MTEIKAGDRFRLNGIAYHVIDCNPGELTELIIKEVVKGKKLTGSDLSSHRKKVEHVCDNPKCGKIFLGYAHAKSCKDCSAHMRYLRHKSKKIKSG